MCRVSYAATANKDGTKAEQKSVDEEKRRGKKQGQKKARQRRNRKRAREERGTKKDDSKQQAEVYEQRERTAAL